MSIKTQFKVMADQLHVDCSGIFTNDAILGATEEIFAAAQKEKIKKVLIDMRQLEGQSPTTIARYELGQKFAEIQRSTDMQIKVAVVGKAPLVDPQRLSETVALNRGAFLKVFTGISSANKWLDKQDS